MESGQLVPGDVFVIPEGHKMPCDAVLLNGESIMNEAMLTGESIPAVKVAIPNSDTLLTQFSIENKDQEKHFLFSGTEVVQNRYGGEDGVLGIAVKTGFMSAKGELVKSILYPSPSRFKFKQEMYQLLLGFF
jgi:cation-transporting ATPase 13A2